MRTGVLAFALATVMAVPAMAEFAPVRDKATFVGLVAGKTLTRPLIKLRVSTDGAIAGRGASWDVTGNWTWNNGYFCRDLYWGGDDLGYNCQEVLAAGDRIRFVENKGAGRSADFRLR